MVEKMMCEYLKIGKEGLTPRVLCKRLSMTISYTKPVIKTLDSCPFRDERDDSCGVISCEGEKHKYDLWRQDDRGNRYLMGSFNSRDAALREQIAYESRGHKQFFEVKKQD